MSGSDNTVGPAARTRTIGCVDCESMIARWINYEAAGKRLLAAGSYGRRGTRGRSCICHTCITHTRAGSGYGRYILSTVTLHSTEVKSCLTATRFEGHYMPDVRVKRSARGLHYQNSDIQPEYLDSLTTRGRRPFRALLRLRRRSPLAITHSGSHASYIHAHMYLFAWMRVRPLPADLDRLDTC